MKGKALVAGLAGVAGLVVVSSASAAEPFDTKLQASTFNSKLVQAVDECAVGTTVVNLVPACIPSNDDIQSQSGYRFNSGKIVVKSKFSVSQVIGILKSSGTSGNTLLGDGPKKQLAGKSLKIRLVLRVSSRTNTGLSLGPITYEDYQVDCFPSIVGTSGNYVFKASLAGAHPTGCNLPSALAANDNQKEVISAAIVNGTTGAAVGVPGVRKKL